MKKVAFFIAFMMPMMIFGQTYKALWKQVEDAVDDDLPKSEQQILDKIVAKATKEKAYGQLLKAELQKARSQCDVSPDTLQSVVSRLQQREQKEKDAVVRAIYQTVLGYLYEQNEMEESHSEETARQYYDKALSNPALLASVQAKDYTPFVVTEDDSRIYAGDLLSVIGYETQHFDVLRDYYTKTDNRTAALMSSLEWLRQQRPEELEKIGESVYLARLDSLIDAYADLPEVAEVGIERYYYMTENTDATVSQRWDYLNMALNRWSNWPRIKRLINSRNNLQGSQFTVQGEGTVLPGKPFTVSLKDMRNISELTMRVFRVDAKASDLAGIYLYYNRGYERIKPLLRAMPELTQTLTYEVRGTRYEVRGARSEGKTPYEFYDDSLTLAALPVGIYMLEYESRPSTGRVERSLCYVSNLRVLSQMLPGNKIRYVVVNATTGQPVAGARLTLEIDRETTVLTTDAKGECELEVGKRHINSLYVTTADDSASPAMNRFGYFSYASNHDYNQSVEVFTDRSIYRPGQTVYMSAILYETRNGFEHSVRKGKTVTARLRDANYKVVEEHTLTTDDYGTCTTSFTLPRKGLTGSFSVEVDGKRRYFTVDEYKRPTFEVEIPDVKEDYADGDTLQVKGTARSYAGVPVQGARVKYKVERRRAYWWWSYSRYWNQGYLGEGSEDNEMASGEIMTDGDGSFTVSVPLVVPKTRYPMFYNFVLTAYVTDQAGETRYGELSIPLGNRKTAFSVDVPEKVLAEKGGNLTFHLRNAAGNDIDASVRYRFDNGRWQDTGTNKRMAIPLLKSGSHTVEAVCGEDTLHRNFVVFSLKDRRPAIETDDWFYVSDTQFPNDGSPVTLQVGSSASDVHIVYAIVSGDVVIEKGSTDKSNELINRQFAYKESYGNGLFLTFAWMKEGKTYVHETTIRRPLPDYNLKLEWQTFRNRLLPGQKEEWTLTIKGPDGTPADAQLLATLYDKSLDQLQPHEWMLTPYLSLPISRTSWRYSSWGFPGCSSVESVRSLSYPELLFSHFDHNVYPSAERSRMRIYRRMDAPLLMSRGVMEKKTMGAAQVEYELVEESNSTADMAAADGVAADEDAGDSVEQEQQSKSDNVQMRENLQETAFFYPQLMADKDGQVSIKFTLPESLTTWRFMAIGHTQDMKVGMLTDEAVAKKDVMIQPNVPRFVRMGDKASISARIFNTGEKAVNGKARLELLDPETEKVVYADEQPVAVDVNGTAAVTFLYDCSRETRSLLVAKVMVSGDGFSDGEQHYLPVLPNRERVTVTVPFTQNEPGTKTIDLQALLPQNKAAANSCVPSVASDQRSSASLFTPFPTNGRLPVAFHSSLTIEYTNNPAWLMIQALPTVGHPHDNCAICQSASYYANSIGRYILNQNPQAESIFEVWRREDTPLTSLNSSLQKNQELKDLVLEETPWVMDAEREQEQKERLADFFDENLIDQRISGSLENLEQLQNGDGSWSWWPGMLGSMYMTVEVSEMLVRLNQMTEEQDETEDMLEKAFGFMGQEIVDMVKEMKKNEKKGWTPRFPSHLALQWLYICTLDGRELPGSMKAANDYLIKLLKKETRNQSIYDKAMSAIVLNNKTYIKSLKEYTVYTEEMGRYYDTPRALYSWRNFRIPTQVAAIEAIKRLTPEDTQTIEEMQRWLLQEKRNQAWDTPINSVDAVYAFLNGNSQVLEAQPKTVLKVDGQEIETSQATAGIGYVKTAMDGDGKQTFTAEKTSTGTSWGAVYMQFMQQTGDITDQSSGITVKREILSAEPNSTFDIQHSVLNVGDRIKVRITITADRDYDFVQVVDKRAACMEPVNQLSGYHWGYYCTPKDCSTNYYFDRLAKGRHVVETEYYIDRVGTYETGTCTAGCAYSPEFRGTTKSVTLEVKE